MTLEEQIEKLTLERDRLAMKFYALTVSLDPKGVIGLDVDLPHDVFCSRVMWAIICLKKEPLAPPVE